MVYYLINYTFLKTEPHILYVDKIVAKNNSEVFTVLNVYSIVSMSIVVEQEYKFVGMDWYKNKMKGSVPVVLKLLEVPLEDARHWTSAPVSIITEVTDGKCYCLLLVRLSGVGKEREKDWEEGEGWPKGKVRLRVVTAQSLLPNPMPSSTPERLTWASVLCPLNSRWRSEKAHCHRT